MRKSNKSKLKKNVTSFVLGLSFFSSLPCLGGVNGSDSQNSTPSTSATEKAQESGTSPYYAILPESKTLPAKILRVWFPVKFIYGSTGFDSSGHKEDLGLKLRATGGAFVVEYGLTKTVTLQVAQYYISANNLGLDADKFRNSNLYKSAYNDFLTKISAALQAKGVCTSDAACLALLESGYSLPSDTPVVLPTGETLVIKANVPVKAVADSLVVGAARPQNGTTGLADLEAGLLWNFLPKGDVAGVEASLGGGCRVPVGKFKDVPGSQRETGRGSFGCAVKIAADYTLAPGLLVSFQNQIEKELLKGKKSKTSLLDNSKLNEADPRLYSASATGNSQEFSLRGFRNQGLIALQYGFGALTTDLNPLGTYAQYRYDIDQASYLDGVAQGGRPQKYSLLVGAYLDGLAAEIPVQLKLEYEVPVAGKNQKVAQENVAVVTRVFYKF